MARLNTETTGKLFASHLKNLEIIIPFQNEEKIISFQSNEIHAPGFKVLNAKNKEVSGLDFPLHFKSLSQKGKKEFSALSLFSNGQIVMVFSSQDGNLNISQMPDSLGDSRDYIFFYDHDIVNRNPFECHFESLSHPPKNKKKGLSTQQTENDTTCKLTEIYWECDHDMFERGGNSIQGALNSFEAMFNGTAILYEIENVNIGVKAVKVWDEPDPYTYTSSFSALGDFMDAGNAANWPGQLAHLLSTRNLSLGGVAFLDAICTSFRYGFSNIDFNFPPLFTYSWTLSTIAHELGHNFSSPHTHNCNWEVQPGVFQQIDSCWNAEGDCQPVIRGRVGTIMSYCHLTGSVNLSLGFGPLVGNRIREAYENMSCVSGTILIPNFTPITSGAFCVGDTVELAVEDLPGFTYKWSGPNGFESTSRIARIPNAIASLEGNYGLRVKKAACESREKKTFLEFNCMKVGQTPQAICAGSVVSVPFSSTGEFNPGNRFILQLSNGLGSFSNPVNLDTLESPNPQAIQALLPPTLALGNNYRFRFMSTNPAYEGKPKPKGFTINPMGVSPIPQNGERCGPGILQIGVGGGSGITWYESASNPFPIAFSRRYNTPFLNQTRSYFAQSGSTSKTVIGPNLSSSSGLSNQTNGLIFNALGTIRLDSLSLFYNAFSGKIFVIRLEKDGTVLQSHPVFGNSNGTSKIPLFWRIDPGTNYRLICDSLATGLALSSGAWGSYPIQQNSVINITGPIQGSSSVYPYFFSLVINRFSSCPSRRVEVLAKINPGTVPAQPSIQTTSGDSVICPQAAVQYEWQVNGQLVPNYNFPKVRGLTNATYIVRIRLDSCWSEWSAPFVFVPTTSVYGLEENQIQVYPNPATDFLTLELGSEIEEISLFEATGKWIWSKRAEPKENLSIANLPKGIYFIRWKSPNKNGLVSFVKN